MKKRILTLQMLADYFEQNKIYSFNSADTDTQLVVQIPANFSNEESDESDGFLHVKLRACHIDRNRNGSYVSEENMKKAMPTLKNRPVMAAIHKIDSGEYEFHAHDMVIDDEGNTEYIECQVGSFTEDDPYLEYNEEYDKTYVMANAVIPLWYSKAPEIIKRHNGTKVSVELVIDNLAYNAKEKYLELIDFRFGACTLLGYEKNGDEIGEGMLGSRLDISDFSIKKGSYDEDRTKNVEPLEDPESDDSNFNTKEPKKGGVHMSKLDELMALYNVKSEDITFETDDMTDDELTQAFADAFGKKDPEQDPEPTPEKNTKKCSVVVDDHEYNFELSLNDKIYALQSLVNDTYSENDNAYYSVYAYEKYIVMRDIWSDRAFRQEYKCRKDTYSLTGDRVEVFANYLTKDEEAELDRMRSNYAELESFKEQAEADTLRAKKLEILNSDKYECLSEIDAFKELKENIDKYSLDEVIVQAKVVFADNIESINFDQKPQKSHVGVGYGETKEAKPYGDLFD